MRLIVGISGATGAIYGIRLLEVLKQKEIETHLVLSNAAVKTIGLETDYTVEYINSLATEVHDIDNIGASIASGSFLCHGMIIAPCSIKTLSALANSYNDNLLIRAGDVTLKEKRRLVVVVRETPLHTGHLKSMLSLAEMGAVILPPMPSFYHGPKTIDHIINQTIGKVLDQFSIEANLFNRWHG